MQTRCPAPEAFAAYAEGRLPDADRSRFEAHLESCTDCVGRLSVLLSLRDIPEPAELPPLSADTLGSAGHKLAGRGPDGPGPREEPTLTRADRVIASRDERGQTTRSPEIDIKRFGDPA